jgi:hypothetical protein
MCLYYCHSHSTTRVCQVQTWTHTQRKNSDMYPCSIENEPEHVIQTEKHEYQPPLHIKNCRVYQFILLNLNANTWRIGHLIEGEIMDEAMSHTCASKSLPCRRCRSRRCAGQQTPRSPSAGRQRCELPLRLGRPAQRRRSIHRAAPETAATAASFHSA